MDSLRSDERWLFTLVGKIEYYIFARNKLYTRSMKTNNPFGVNCRAGGDYRDGEERVEDGILKIERSKTDTK